MSQLVASDVNHPDYVGQRNPDAALSVLFYSKPQQNNFESEKQGRPIFYDADMVKIFLPGDDKTVIDTFAREDHKRRFPLQWAHFSNKKEGDQRLAGKTPISQWQRITPAQAEELRAMKFIAVEDVANASDGQLQAIGMCAGMAPHAFRLAAQSYLRVAAGEAQETKTAEALATMTAENDTMKQQMAAMMARLEALAAATPPAASPFEQLAIQTTDPVAEPTVTTKRGK
jgi:hypothetical protein